MIEPISKNMITSIKMIYSEQIIEQIKEEKRKYFFDVLNSIPDDLFNTKNPRKILRNGKKLSSFLHHYNEELREEGMNMEPLERNLKENNEKYKKLIRRF